MRYISNGDFELPKGWLEKAEEAHLQIEQLEPDERRKAIGAMSGLWQELKVLLSELSHGKCWYCEARELRSDNAVDHFRPKNRVAECSEHEGYWWLAFDWKNYRFSCTFCNSRRIDTAIGHGGGKQDHFPLVDESRRARFPSDRISDEEPCLLDPTVQADPILLWFDEDGSAVPRYRKELYPNRYERALRSIDLYHLNQYEIKAARMIWHKNVKRLVTNGDRYFDRIAGGETDDAIRHAFDQVVLNLKEMLSKKAEYSAATRAYVMGLREAGSEWLDLVL